MENGIKSTKSEKGFLVFLLDLLFITIGILILIMALLKNQDNLASIIGALKKSF